MLAFYAIRPTRAKANDKIAAMRFLAGFVSAIVLFGILGFLYFQQGYAPVATAASPMPFEKMLAQMGLNARIAKDAPTKVPIDADETALTAGARIYRKDCAICHGLPNQPESAMAKGMYPAVPQLFVHKVTDDPAGQTYWIVANGIRLTGMAAFKGSLSETELWQVSLMLANADKLPAAATALLNKPLQPPN
jgi:thiosulfate dehydrogenase